MFSRKSDRRRRTFGFLLMALGLQASAGCRYAVQPAWIFGSAEIGETVSDTITIRNIGNDDLLFDLSAPRPDVVLSPGGLLLLTPGRGLSVAVSATCREPGVFRDDILMDVDGLAGGARTIPLELRCHAADAARLASVEIFQGPPVYRKDFETGRVDGWTPLPVVENYWSSVSRGLAVGHYWSSANRGFATPLWRRWAVAAVAVRHPDRNPPSDVSAAVEGPDGDVADLGSPVYRESERSGDGWITDTAFHIDRSLYVEGAVLRVSAGGGTERVRLVGHDIHPLRLTWIPILIEGVGIGEEQDIVEPESWTREGVLPLLPVADYTTKKGEPMVYEPTGAERNAGPGDDPIDSWRADDQLRDHRALHSCDRGEVYVGVYNRFAVEQAGFSHTSPNLGGGRVATIGAGWKHPAKPGLLSSRGTFSTIAHEMGHVFGLRHAPGSGAPNCPARPNTLSRNYPYGGGRLGPARSWDLLDRRFNGRVDEHRGVSIPAEYGEHLHIGQDPRYRDVMSYCPHPKGVSDYHYQLALLGRLINANIFGKPGCGNERRGSGVAAKSARASGSVAVTGTVDADGAASVRMASVVDGPAWDAPPDGDLVLTVLDSSGGELHREPLRTSVVSHSGGARSWSARVPRVEGAAEIVVRSSEHGDVRASRDILETPEARTDR